MINEIQKDSEVRMQKSVETLRTNFIKIRTGRAHPSLLDHIMVSYYGTEMPLNQVSSVTVGDSRTLVITPWEKTMVQPIEKAIMQSNLGLNPATAGQVIRVPLPPLTEERRKDLVKVIRSEAESSRVAIRNIRRDANTHIKDLLKTKKIGEDDEKHAEDIIQKTTDKYIGEVDTMLSAKEKELMEV
jgi:ribosome recycling factor